MARLFVAIDLPDSIREKLATLSGGLPGARWVSADRNEGQTTHLTLRFIGEVDGTMSNDIADALSTIEGKPFPIKIKGLGFFPPRREPKVLWAGIEKNETLTSLRNKIERLLTDQGCEAEKKKFTPH